MSNKRLYDLYEKFYFFEASRASKVSDRIQLFPLIFIAITSGIGFSLNKFLGDIDSPLYNIFLIMIYAAMMIFVFIFLVYSCYHFYNAFLYTKRYLYIESLVDIDNYKNSITNEYKASPYSDESISIMIEDDVNKYFYGALIEYTDKNAKVSDDRQTFISKSMKSLFISVIILTIILFLQTITSGYIMKNRELTTAEVKDKVKPTASFPFKPLTEPPPKEGRPVNEDDQSKK